MVLHCSVHFNYQGAELTLYASMFVVISFPIPNIHIHMKSRTRAKEDTLLYSCRFVPRYQRGEDTSLDTAKDIFLWSFYLKGGLRFKANFTQKLISKSLKARSVMQ